MDLLDTGAVGFGRSFEHVTCPLERRRSPVNGLHYGSEMLMVVVYCPRHGDRVLLGYRSLEAMANTADGVLVRWRCWCGARGTLRTGCGAGCARHTTAHPAA